MKSKKITKSGGLTIPADLRRAVNLMPGDAVDIDILPGIVNQIIVTAHIPRCFICNSEQDVHNYHGLRFCENCIQGLGGLINEC